MLGIISLNHFNGLGASIIQKPQSKLILQVLSHLLSVFKD